MSEMKKFINHIDHVTWISHMENLIDNVSMLEKVSGVKMELFENEQMGFVMYLNWEAGMEVIAPRPERTEFNRALHERLETQGEGVLAVVFGIKNLEEHRARLEAQGFGVGPLMGENSAASWRDKVVVRERIGPTVINSWFVLGDVDYADDVISFVDA